MINYLNRCFIGPPLALINAYNTVGIAILPLVQFFDLMLTAKPDKSTVIQYAQKKTFRARNLID